MAWVLGNVASAAGSGSPATATTAAIDTTGATLLVAIGGAYAGTVEYGMSDSAGNTWEMAVSENATLWSVIFYCINPTTSAEHTFSFGPVGYPGLSVAAFSGFPTISLDQTNSGSGAGASTVQPGSVTPTTDGQLIVTGYTDGSAAVPAIDDSFDVATYIEHGGSNESACIGYLDQATGSPLNPTWSGGQCYAATIASFKGTG
ncbi:MAG: hypothetical protein ACREFX_07455, partial [Opitutaceae bacterium]